MLGNKRYRIFSVVANSMIAMFIFTFLQSQFYLSHASTDYWKPRLTLPLPGGVNEAALDPDEEFYITGSADNYITIWSLRDSNVEPKFVYMPTRNEELKNKRGLAVSRNLHKSNNKKIFGAAFSVPRTVKSDGSSKENTAKIYLIDLKRQEIYDVIDGLPSHTESIAFSHNGKYLAAAFPEGRGVIVWDVVTKEKIFTSNINPNIQKLNSIEPMEIIRDVKFNPNTNGAVFLAAIGTSGLILYDKNWKEITHPEIGNIYKFGDPNTISFSPNGNYIAIGNSENYANLRRRIPIKNNQKHKNNSINNIYSITIVNLENINEYINLFALSNRLCDEQNLREVAWGQNGDEVFAAGWFHLRKTGEDWDKSARSEELHTIDDVHRPCFDRANSIVKWRIDDPNNPEYIRFAKDVNGQVEKIDTTNDGNLIFLAQTATWGVVDQMGKFVDYPEIKKEMIWRGVGANLRTFGNFFIKDFFTNPEGTQVVFRELFKNKEYVSFNLEDLSHNVLSKRRIIERESEGLLILAESNKNGISVSNRRMEDADSEVLVGKFSIPLAHGEKSRAITFFRNHPNGKYRFISATTSRLRVFSVNKGDEFTRENGANKDALVPQKIWERYVKSKPLRVTTNADNSLSIVAFEDGTIRWYDNKNKGKLLLNVFFFNDNQNWVAWTSDGFFSYTANSSKYLGRIMKHQKMQYLFNGIGDGYFFNVFYCPEIIKTILIYRNVDEAVKNATKSKCPRAGEYKDVKKEPVLPEVLILSPDTHDIITDDTINDSGDLNVRFQVRGTSSANTANYVVQLFANGGPIREVSGPFEAGTVHRTTIELPPPLMSGGGIKIQARVVIPEARDSDLNARDIVPVISGNRSSETMKDGRAQINPKDRTLYLFVIGIGAYEKQGRNLHHAHHDAEDVLEFWKTQIGPNKLYQHIVPRFLIGYPPESKADDVKKSKNRYVSKSPTYVNINDFFVELESKYGRKIKKQDVVILHIAAHGAQAGRHYYLWASDSNFESTTDGILLPRNAIKGSTITSFMKTFGKSAYKYIFLDTCRDREIDIALFRKLFTEDAPNVYTFIANNEYPEAYEHESLNPMPGRGNGVFTWAILEGLKGGADGANFRPNDRVIDIRELREWVEYVWSRLVQKNPGYWAKKRPVQTPELLSTPVDNHMLAISIRN